MLIFFMEADRYNSEVAVEGSASGVYRHGEYFRKELYLNNTSAAQYPTLDVDTDVTSALSGEKFLAKQPESFSHDADGNLTQDGRWDYVWDGENRLIKLRSRSGSPAPERRVEFEYDWQGRRIHQTVFDDRDDEQGDELSDTLYLYDGWNLIGEFNANASNEKVRTYIWGLDLSGSMEGAGGVGGLLMVIDHTSGPKRHYVAYDGNGNVMALVDSTTGDWSARYEYGPFGEPIRANGDIAEANPFRFSTKYQDSESDLLYYGYRCYCASTGKWLSRDPVGEEGFKLIRSSKRWGYSEELNLYRFVGNDPITAVDWLGLANPCGTDECKCLGCMVFAESRGTSDACQKAVANVIKQRAWKDYNKYRSFCDVVAEREGREFNGYNTSNYKTCCEDKCVNKPNGPQDKTERDTAFKNSECDVAAGSYAPGANFFNNASLGVPDWIKRRMDQGKAYEVKVPGCSTFKFFHVDPQ